MNGESASIVKLYKGWKMEEKMLFPVWISSKSVFLPTSGFFLDAKH